MTNRFNKRIKELRKERYYDILKNPKCYVLTCKRHNKDVEK